MARTDRNDKRPGWTLVGALNAIRNTFFGGGPQLFIPAGGHDGVQYAGKVLPATALLAKRRVKEVEGYNGIQSRMEEAKVKQQVWNNELEPLILDKLAQMFHPENYIRMRLQPNASQNLMRRIVEDISCLYENKADRYLDEDREAAEKQGQTEQTSADAAKNKKPMPEQDDENPAEDAAPDEENPEDAPSDAADRESAAEDQTPDEEKPEDAVPPKKDGTQPPPSAPALQTGEPDVDALIEVLDLEGSEKRAKESPLDKLYEMSDLDIVLDTVEKLCRIHEAVWVRPLVTYGKKELVKVPVKDANGNDTNETMDVLMGDPATGKLSYIIYTPAEADVIPDPANPSQAIAFYYFGEELNERGEMDQVIHFFSEEHYWKMNKDWKPVLDQENILGRLPVTVFRKELPSNNDYFCNGVGRDLLQATMNACILRTIQDARYRDTGFKQLALMNVDPDNVPADQVMGGPSPVYIPDGGSATVLDMTPNLRDMTDTLKERILEVAASYGITAADFKLEGGPQSGFAKKLDRDKVLKENRRIRKFFAAAEKDLYNLTALTLAQFEIKDAPKLDAEKTFCIDFAEPSFDEDPKTQASIDATRIKLNTMSIIDVLKRENPDLNEAELVEMAYKNKRINEVLIPSNSMKLIDILSGASQQELGFERASAGKGGGGGPPPPGGDKPAPGGGGGKPPFGK